MLHAHPMERAIDALLEQREGALNGIGVVLAFRIALYMVNHAVIHKTPLADYVVDGMPVCLERRIRRDMLTSWGSIMDIFASLIGMSRRSPPR